MPMDFNTMKAEFITNFETETGQSLTAEQEAQVTPLFLAMAKTIVQHVQTNADVSVSTTITVANAGLQTTTVPGSPTGPPAVPQSLSGTGGVA